jgi:hypothetical protein
MKLDQLRKIIREEVRAAVKEELQEVMNEAVKIASTPTKMQAIPEPKGSNLKWSTPATGRKSLDEMLSATKADMTNEDFRSIGNFDSTKAPNFAQRQITGGGGAGLDLSTIPGFDPQKAKAILDKSIEKDKTRSGA